MSPAGDQQTPQERLVEHAPCLGCGCACDDIAVRLRNDRIRGVTNACELGVRWFGDGATPSAITVNGRDAALADALTAIAATMRQARDPLVYLAPDISCEAQGEAIALADRIRGALDTVSSATVLPSILASQERGRAAATLGEIRNRADVIVFWGVDPSERYPRYLSRYAPQPAGLHVEDGRAGRRVIAVDVGERRGPADADVRIAVDERDEVSILTAATAMVRKAGTSFAEPLGSRAASLVAPLVAGRYVALVADAEPQPSSMNDPRTRFGDPQRSAALIAFTQALNGPTRCALSTLRAGGNRSGAEAVLTAHTGYPTGVSYANGYPVYRPHDVSHATDAVLLVGDASHVPADLLARFARGPLAIIGPRASMSGAGRTLPASPQAPGPPPDAADTRATDATTVIIDTGVAGIHVNGTALRMDDVPLRLRPSLHRGLDPADVVRALRERMSE